LQQLLAPVLVAEVTEDDSADRTRDEADRIGGEAGENRRERIVRGREQNVEHQCGCGCVEEELIPLDDRSGHRGDDDLAQLSADRLLLGAVLGTHETPSIPQSASPFIARIVWRVVRRLLVPGIADRVDAADGTGTVLGTSAARTLLIQASVCVTLQSFGKFL